MATATRRPGSGEPRGGRGDLVAVREGSDVPDQRGGDLGHAITVLRARVDEEFRISERLDAKSRQAFALSALFFGVVQTVAFGSFAEDSVNGTERVFLLAAVVVAGVALATVAHRLTGGEELQEEADIVPDAIVGWCNEAGDDPEYVSSRLVRELGRVARERTENNATRGRNYDVVVVATRWTLILSGVELAFAIVARL